AYCATCHPEATAESRQNTHGRAFTDEEARLATARFSIEGCIACHTPRPVFETGIGMNPKKRLAHLEEGDDCFSCHARKGFDFSTFVGSKAECKAAFDERVGTVEACASCHKNHGTPYQWESAKHGKLEGNVCIDCHMPKVVRAVAVGEAPRETRRHTFYASRSESQLRMAYAYRTRIDGNEAVVTIENKGAGHNFPTELKQRAVESLVIVRDLDGNVVANSRQVHRDPYKRPYGLMLPVNTQIPSGESREHRVPISVAAGTVETTLFYKLYYPIEDDHPTMSRRLETRIMAFSGITPSTKPITSAPELNAHLPEALPVEAASPGNLVDFARPKIGKVEVEIPDGTQPGDVAKLIALFQFPVGEANRKAQDILVTLGPKAAPELVAALGSWDGKTWTQAKGVLGRMGDVGRKAVVEALSHQELYVRLHAIEALPKFGDLGPDRADAIARLKLGLKSPDALARAGSAQALGNLMVADAAPLVQPLLDELDWDVCACAARALAALGDKSALPKLRSTFDRVKPSLETGRDLAWSMATLGDTYGMQFMLDGLAYSDDLVRESFFENFLDLTGMSKGYAPMLPIDERLTTLANLRNWWATEGGAKALRTPRTLQIPGSLRGPIEALVKEMGGDDMKASTPQRDEAIVGELKQRGAIATPMLVDGLKWPAGFTDKRAGLLRVLAESPDPDALAALIDAARDPVTAVALWAIEGLGTLRNPAGIEAVNQFEQRFEGLVANQRIPQGLGSADQVRALVARARARMGDSGGGEILLGLLWSRDPLARLTAEETLSAEYGTEEPDEMPVALNARQTLAGLADARARELGALQQAWESEVGRAEELADQAKTTEARLAALAAYDKAEAAVARYAQLDPRAWQQDFERTRLGSDAMAQALGRDKSWIESARWRDALAPAERAGWSLGNLASGRADFGTSGLAFEFAAEPKQPADMSSLATLVFGAGERWRDYELDLEATLDSGALLLVDRGDASGAGTIGTLLFCRGTETSGSLPPNKGIVEPGQLIKLRTRVIGGIVERSGVSGIKELSGSTELQPEPRSGGVALSILAGTKARITVLRVRPLRIDASMPAK
ncbi:MAG: HEAT repeat domain-containing protein, partial [Planctomycetota bacterium]